MRDTRQPRGGKRQKMLSEFSFVLLFTSSQLLALIIEKYLELNKNTNFWRTTSFPTFGKLKKHCRVLTYMIRERYNFFLVFSFGRVIVLSYTEQLWKDILKTIELFNIHVKPLWSLWIWLFGGSLVVAFRRSPKLSMIDMSWPYRGKGLVWLSNPGLIIDQSLPQSLYVLQTKLKFAQDLSGQQTFCQDAVCWPICQAYLISIST